MFELVRKELAEYFAISPETITRDTNFVTDLKADSLAIAELMFELESKADIIIGDDAMDTVKTVGDLCDYIDKLKK